MPIGEVISFSLLAAAVAGLATFLALLWMRERRTRARPPRCRQASHTDVLALPNTQLDAEPALDLRIAWHVARRARVR